VTLHKKRLPVTYVGWPQEVSIHPKTHQMSPTNSSHTHRYNPQLRPLIINHFDLYSLCRVCGCDCPIGLAPSPAGQSRSIFVPSRLLTGFLGSGKTTVVNHILRNAEGKRFAVRGGLGCVWVWLGLGLGDL
jgi:hypothetical protein